MQVCHEQVLSGHYAPNFQHNAAELLVVFLHQGLWAQVKQASLTAQVVVYIPKFTLQLLTECLPITVAQNGPWFNTNRSPPSQSTVSQQGHHHLYNLFGPCDASDLAELVYVEQPIAELLNISIIFFRFLQLQIAPCNCPWSSSVGCYWLGDWWWWWCGVL